jgi:hypothetical protein
MDKRYEKGPWSLGHIDYDRGDGAFADIDLPHHGAVLTAVYRMADEEESPRLEEHARRVVASLNACAGIDVRILHDPEFKKYVKLAADFMAIQEGK